MRAPTSRTTPGRLERYRWAGDQAYRVLDYYFTIRHNRWGCGPVADYLDHVLGGFATDPDGGETRNPPTPGLPPVYSLISSRAPDRPFALFYNETNIYGARSPGEVLAHLLWHINAEAVRQTGSYLLIHAGAVVADSGKAILLPAASGSGKTTLTAGLVRSGFAYLSDEAAAIDPVSGEVYGYPKALTLKDPAMIAHLGCSPERPEWSSLTMQGRHVHPSELGASATRSAPIGWVVSPRYEAGAATELRALRPAQVAATLLGQTMNRSKYRRRSLAVVARIAETTSGFELVSGDLDEAVEQVRRLTVPT